MLSSSCQPTRPVYLVVMDEVLVAEDISQAIRSFDPSAVVLRAQSCEAAVALLDGNPSLEFAFVEMSDLSPGCVELAKTVEALSGRMVLLGYGSEDTPHLSVWKSLRFPFSGEDIMGVLGGGNTGRESAKA